MMKKIIPILLVLILGGCLDRYSRATSELNGAKTEVKRFYALEDAAKESFNAGKTEEARERAVELLELAPK